VLSLHDVTERVRNAEELEQQVERRTAALRASQARFQAVFEDAAIGIALVDDQGRVVTSNPALQNMLGYTAEELENLALAALTHADNVVDDMDLYSELMTGKRDYYQVEGRYLRKDGQAIYTNLTVSLVRWTNINERFAIVMVEDVTERKQAQAALIQSEKLALTGRLAAALAHEINNPLQSVIGFMSLAKELVEERANPQAVEEYIQIAIEEVRRAASIVAQMRDLNRKSKPDERQPGDVNDLMARVLTLSQKKFQERHVTVEWDAAEDLPLIPLFPNRVQQVFLNLLLNALEAMPDGGKLYVSTTRTTVPEGVQVRFTDTGMGIPGDQFDRLFEPFFTTKPTGMGLGLYVSQIIVEEHGGQIMAESLEDDGAIFNVWLPA
jgi:PAS domain S-box-containing protein